MKIPDKFLERMRGELGDEFESFVKCYEEKPYMALRVNTLKISSEDFKKTFDFCGEKVEWCENGFYYSGKMGLHPASMAGLFYSQEPSAMLSAQLADIQEGDFVLDLCAAPGGKSTQLAALLCGSGLLVSNEVVLRRASILAQNIERMGVRNAVVTNMYPEKLEHCFEEYFDKIVVDAPCSGEGMFRKEPAAAEEWSIEHTRSCAVRQKAILKSAFKMLKKGGRLVYSTCTFSREENEELCECIVKELDGIKLTEMHRLMPHKVKGEGHFAAVFEKQGQSERKIMTVKSDSAKQVLSLYRDFEIENLNITLDGDFRLFGSHLYLVPNGAGSLDKIKCVRAGLLLGEIVKNRFVPAHQLCMALKKENFKRSISLNDEMIDRYRRGESIQCESQKGFGAMLYMDRFPLGWYKYSDGYAKNHYPKYLRDLK